MWVPLRHALFLTALVDRPPPPFASAPTKIAECVVLLCRVVRYLPQDPHPLEKPGDGSRRGTRRQQNRGDVLEGVLFGVKSGNQGTAGSRGFASM